MSQRREKMSAARIIAASLLLLLTAAARGDDPLDQATLAPQSASKADSADQAATGGSPSKTEAKPRAKSKPEFINKPVAEWRRLLTRAEFAVTREKATEQPYSGKYATGHYKGTFVCACCDAANVESDLFSSQTKFDSGTGWPSFYQPVNATAVQTAADNSLFETRMEVLCRRCGAHLGHVFDDGPPPTGLRFCINSVALKLKAPAGEPPSARTPSKAKSKTVSKQDEKAPAKSSGNQTDSKPTASAADTPAPPASAPPSS